MIARPLAAACLLAFSWANAQPPAEARTPPKSLVRVEPEYPAKARRKGIEGRVVAHVDVDAEGNVQRVRIRKSPDESLSDAVEAALMKWKFQPATKDGAPAASVGEYEFAFKLEADEIYAEDLLEPAPDQNTVARYVASMDGVEAFRNHYWRSRGHRAFAAAHDGAWGWVAARPNPEDAMQGALDACEKGRTPLTRACRIVSIDGKWERAAERSATPLFELSPLELSSHRREAVDKWEEPRKAKALPFLDQCRAEADRFVQTWRSQDLDAIYAGLAHQVREKLPRADFEKSVAAMRALAGKPGAAVYHDQELVTRWGDDDLRLETASVVTYSTTGSAWKGPGLYLVLSMYREGALCRVFALQYFSPNAGLAPQPGVDAERGT